MSIQRYDTKMITFTTLELIAFILYYFILCDVE